MDRHTRKDLKTDKFAQEMTHGFTWITHHGREAVRYGGIALAVVVIGFGTFFYMRHQAGVREEALAQALRIDDAAIGPAGQTPDSNLHFDTVAQKDQARTKAYTELVAKYHGTQEGAIAAIYLAADLADKGRLPEAEKAFQDIVELGSQAVCVTRPFVAGRGLFGGGEGCGRGESAPYRGCESQRHRLQGRSYARAGESPGKKDPAEARKMLNPLQTSPRGAVSKAAITAMSQLPPAAK